MEGDLPSSPAFGAEARFLSGDEAGALSAWVGAAIAMVGMLVAACALASVAFLYLRHRNRSGTREVQKMPKKMPQAWSDPERGEGPGEAVSDKAPAVHSEPVVPDKLSASVRLELAETLRGILEDEIGRGLKASGISDRLGVLEQQMKEQQVLSGALLPPPCKRAPTEALDSAGTDLDHTLKIQAASSGSSSECAATLKPEAKQVAKRDVETSTERQSLADVATLTEGEAESGSDSPAQQLDSSSDAPARVPLTLSPSARQKRYADPPEKGWMYLDADRSLRMTLQTVQRNLQKRDGQTQELHRQLRQTQVDCQHQKLEATYAARKLQDLLSDPSHAPQAQAESLSVLRKEVDDLSGRLADAKQSEVQWQLVAKRQRAFFMQSERVAQEGVNVFRKHPAGELFLAPPPVCLDDDMEEDARRPPWDIGSSHINPYVSDSWPFEPNACAQRCAAEPNLGRWDEEDGDCLVESDSEDGSNGSGGADDDALADAERERLMLRLPTLPPESPPRDELEFEPPEPLDAPEPLPALGALSARSF